MVESKRYTHEQWERLLASSIAEIQKLSKLKGGEYAGDMDRLANFRRNGEALGQEPELVWAVYAGKHWDAIQQYCKDLAQGKTRQRAEPISGRLDDLIVYCLLMKAMVEEREEVAPKRIAYTPGPRQAIAEYPILQPTNIVEIPLQVQTSPECPMTGREHIWGTMNRHTDACAACGAMRPHRSRR